MEVLDLVKKVLFFQKEKFKLEFKMKILLCLAVYAQNCDIYVKPMHRGRI